MVFRYIASNKRDINCLSHKRDIIHHSLFYTRDIARWQVAKDESVGGRQWPGDAVPARGPRVVQRAVHEQQRRVHGPVRVHAPLQRQQRQAELRQLHVAVGAAVYLLQTHITLYLLYLKRLCWSIIRADSD